MSVVATFSPGIWHLVQKWIFRESQLSLKTKEKEAQKAETTIWVRK